METAPLKLPVRLDLDAYSDAVIHDANWRRIASFPKTELGTAMARQVTDALNRSATHDALVAALKEAEGVILNYSMLVRKGNPNVIKDGNFEPPVIEQIRAALKAAEEEL